MRLVIACAVVVALLGGCAKRDMDECRKGDRSRCPGEASRPSEYLKEMYYGIRA